MTDDLGNVHNVMDVTHYEPYDLFLETEQQQNANLVTAPFTSQLPGPVNAPTTEPPTIPVVLAKSAFVAVEPPLVKMPPNIPLHCIATHFYHDYCRTVRNRFRLRVPPELSECDAESGALRGEEKVLFVALTTRYEWQFTTNILVTSGSRWPLQRTEHSNAVLLAMKRQTQERRTRGLINPLVENR